MTHYKKWDIILVPFPFTNLSATKKRPALVVSPDEYNIGQDVIIAFMTSNLDVLPRVGDYTIQEWEKANLPKPTMIRMKFATIDKSNIIKQFGRLTSLDIEQFSKALNNFFT